MSFIEIKIFVFTSLAKSRNTGMKNSSFQIFLTKYG